MPSQPSESNSKDIASDSKKDAITAKLVELKHLHDSGDLSDAEFTIAKNKILGAEDKPLTESQIHPAPSIGNRKFALITAGLFSIAAIAFLLHSLTPENDKNTTSLSKVLEESDQTKTIAPVEEQNTIADTPNPPIISPPQKSTPKINIIGSLAKRANAGDSEAAYELGQMYWYGKNTIRDKKKAYEWFQLAAGQGDPSSQYIVGMGLYLGISGRSDKEEAAKFFEKAASQGHLDAQINLARMYFFGYGGVPKQYNKAAEWYIEAAKQGHAMSQLQVGYMYSTGRGLPKADYRAFEWYLKAAAQGNLNAQFNLGNQYDQGKGVQQSYPNAMKWWTRSGMQGHKDSLNNLGTYYSHDRIYPEAYAYYTLAAKQGSTLGEENRQKLWRNLVTLNRVADATKGRSIAANLGAVIAFNLSNRPKPKPQGQLVPKPYWALKLKSTGTGFFVSNNGYLVTNHHVIKHGKANDIDAQRIEIRIADGTRLEARIVKEDKLNDLAVLKVPGKNFSALPLALSKSVELGEDIFTVGFPQTDIQGMSVKLTKGSINSLAGLRDNYGQFQHSVPVQPGNSGGPLMDHHGNVVGVVVGALRATQTVKSQNVNYAIKSSLTKKLLEAIPEARENLLMENPRKNTKPFTTEAAKITQAATVLVLVF